jgi:transcriptional regulator with XRE-family HTH domain
MEKPNRERLRKLMGMHDLSSQEVADLLGLSVSSIHQYRAITGQDIDDIKLQFLEYKLAELTQD